MLLSSRCWALLWAQCPPGDILTRLHTGPYGSSSNYIATDSQSASSFWCRAPQILIFFLWHLCHVGHPLWRENRSVICSAITHWLESRRTRNHTLLSHLRLPQPEGQVPIFISRNRVAQLYPRALGSLFVASYDSQGYGGGILTYHHTGTTQILELEFLLQSTASRPLHLSIGLTFTQIFVLLQLYKPRRPG
jgi:hypothetical protein